MMSPNDIEVLIHYHCSPSVHPRIDAPAVSGAIQGFIANNILVEDDSFNSGYRTTKRGQALMEVLCTTAYPTETWIDGNGKVIDINP